ncbi:MAG: tyrosine-type recombinase/integrase [Bacteroidales bacterium]|nr:tyrosine-type recombinase/integrase [Bacteroidales bacterium]
MASIKKRLSTKLDGNGYAQVMFRISVSKNIKIRIKSNVFVPAKRWDETKERINIGKVIGFEKAELLRKESQIREIEQKILKVCEIYPVDSISKELVENALNLCSEMPAQQITSVLLNELVDKRDNPDKYVKRSFFELFKEYLADTKYSNVRERNFWVTYRTLKRYEMFVRLSDYKQKDFTLDIDTINKDTICDIESFLRNEYTLYEDYKNIFQKIDTGCRKSKPKPRGNNTIFATLTKLRSFLNWCYKNGRTTNKPFVGYNGVTTEKYGTPYYITLEERNSIADYDLSDYPLLEVQRDIFVFQCCIGCRISDLLRLTPANIIDGEIHYIPHKTKEDNPTTVQVPLNERALALVEKYKGVDAKGRLFPFIIAQRYNEVIKEVLRKCGIKRMVTILDPTTGEEVKRPICDVASSHMARRCFVGNLYKKVKDPNLICPMSGHKIGSTAFARYREIDKETRIETIKLID